MSTKCSPSLQTRGNTFCSTTSRCKKCHIPISVTPVKSAASLRMPGRWGIWSCHHWGFFLFSMSLHKNSGLTYMLLESQAGIMSLLVAIIAAVPNLLSFWGHMLQEDPCIIIPLPLATGSATRTLMQQFSTTPGNSKQPSLNLSYF